MKFLVDEMPWDKCILFDKGICKGPDDYTTYCPIWCRKNYTDKWHSYDVTECIWLKEKENNG